VCTIDKDDIVPPIEAEVAVASDAVQGAIMPQVKASAASDAARPIAVKIRMRKVQASAFETTSGFQNLKDSCLQGREMRQVEPGQVDEKSENIGGNWALTDGVAAFTGYKAVVANAWVKQHINDIKKLAKSLTYIDTGHSSVSFLELTKNHTNDISQL